MTRPSTEDSSDNIGHQEKKTEKMKRTRAIKEKIEKVPEQRELET